MDKRTSHRSQWRLLEGTIVIASCVACGAHGPAGGADLGTTGGPTQDSGTSPGKGTSSATGSGTGDGAGEGATTDTASATATGTGTNEEGGTGTKSGTATGTNAGTGHAAQVNPTSMALNYPSTWYFNTPITNSPVFPNSGAIITALKANGGWSSSNVFQMDWSIGEIFVNLPAALVPPNSLDASVADTDTLPFVDGGVIQPDSDIPTTVPVLKGAITQEGAGFESTGGETSSGGDDHYVVFDPTQGTAGREIDVYQASVANGKFTTSAGLVIFDPTIAYPINLRGDVCTSADASGQPIGPLLATPDEVAAGAINHALRFILPNSRIQNKQYVHPATHGTGGSGWATTNGVPYGARFRLKSAVTLTNASPAALVFLAALKTYGMILSDGGGIVLSVANDSTFTHKWNDLLPNGSHELYGLTPDDFEMVLPDVTNSDPNAATNQVINFSSYDCTRTAASKIPGTTQ